MFNQLNQITMKVKELKALLEGVDENANVVIIDCNDKTIQIIGGGEMSPAGIVLSVRHEFPECWFDHHAGNEVRYVSGVAIEMCPSACQTDLEMRDENGTMHFTCYDGYAEATDGTRMEYPTYDELTDAQLEEINTVLGGRISKSKVLYYEDVCSVLGKVVKRFDLDRDGHLVCESIQEITLYAWPIIWDNNKYDQDSRNVLETIREWGVEFENYWQGQLDKDENYTDTHSYMEEIDHFAKKKCDEYLEWLKN